MTITIDLSPELQERLLASAAAAGRPAEEIVVGVLADHLNEAEDHNQDDISLLSAEESQLLADINRGLNASQWERYRELVARRRAEALSEPEREELISLCDRVEELNVTRVGKLAELAAIRGVSLESLMRYLEIGRQANG